MLAAPEKDGMNVLSRITLISQGVLHSHPSHMFLSSANAETKHVQILLLQSTSCFCMDEFGAYRTKLVSFCFRVCPSRKLDPAL